MSHHHSGGHSKPLADEPNAEFLDTAKLDFMWKQHGYVSDFVKFADAKAAFIATFASGALGSLGISSLHAAQKFSEWHKLLSIQSSTRFLSVTSLVLCLGQALWTFFPRLHVGPTIGPMSWIEVAAYKSANEFVVSALAKTPRDATLMLTKQIYYMSTVCKRKNRLVQSSMICGGVGLFTLLLSKYLL